MTKVMSDDRLLEYRQGMAQASRLFPPVFLVALPPGTRVPVRAAATVCLGVIQESKVPSQSEP